MTICENITLKPHNTFGIDAKARFYVEVHDLSQLREALRSERHQRKIVLSGGSNILLVGTIDALVVRMCLKGISVEEETDETVLVKAMAGENWHELVLWSLQKGYGGLENLSLIPGCVGTSPIQNIGAYGVELSSVFHACEAICTQTGELHRFFKEDCWFGYRDSIFKNEAKGKYAIVSVSLALSKKNHRLHTQYGSLAAELENMGATDPSIHDVSRAVIRIRQRKLPDPKVLGNAGSFFKNPILGKKQFQKFIANRPDAPFHQLPDGRYKIPAGWLIEQAGFKGKRYGDAGVHDKQALVLVNHGNATGAEILGLSKRIREDIEAKFSIVLETEVNVIEGFESAVSDKDARPLRS